MHLDKFEWVIICPYRDLIFLTKVRNFTDAWDKVYGCIGRCPFSLILQLPLTKQKRRAYNDISFSVGSAA